MVLLKKSLDGHKVYIIKYDLLPTAQAFHLLHDTAFFYTRVVCLSAS